MQQHLNQCEAEAREARCGNIGSSGSIRVATPVEQITVPSPPRYPPFNGRNTPAFFPVTCSQAPELNLDELDLALEQVNSGMEEKAEQVVHDFWNSSDESHEDGVHTSESSYAIWTELARTWSEGEDESENESDDCRSDCSVSSVSTVDAHPAPVLLEMIRLRLEAIYSEYAALSSGNGSYWDVESDSDDESEGEGASEAFLDEGYVGDSESGVDES